MKKRCTINSNITVYAPFDGVIADLEVKEYNQSSAYKEVSVR